MPSKAINSEAMTELLTKVDSLPEGQESYELLVPEEIAQDSGAMAVIVDRLLGKGLFPAGFEQREGARLYRYTKTFPRP